MPIDHKHLVRTPLVLIAILAGGCAATSTKLTSRLDPEAGKPLFKKVVVLAAISDLGLRDEAERGFCREFREKAIGECIPGADVFFPGKVFSPEQVRGRLAGLGADSALILVPGESGSNVVGSIQNVTYGKGWSFHQTSQVSKPWANFSASLIRLSDGNSVWVASASSGGNAYSGYRNLIRGTVGKLVDDLIRYGALEGIPPPPPRVPDPDGLG